MRLVFEFLRIFLWLLGFGKTFILQQWVAKTGLYSKSIQRKHKKRIEFIIKDPLKFILILVIVRKQSVLQCGQIG
jgi:hypothetical protein